MALRLAPVGHGEGLVSVARTRHPACGAEQAERGPRGSGTLLTCPSRISCRSVAGRRIDASSVRISSPTHPPEVGPIEPKGRMSGSQELCDLFVYTARLSGKIAGSNPLIVTLRHLWFDAISSGDMTCYSSAICDSYHGMLMDCDPFCATQGLIPSSASGLTSYCFKKQNLDAIRRTPD